MRSRGISLANKCQLLFGLALLLILTAALSVPWIRMRQMVIEDQREIAERLAQAWLSNVIQLGAVPDSGWLPAQPLEDGRRAGDEARNDSIAADPGNYSLRVGVFPIDQADLLAQSGQGDQFMAETLTRFRDLEDDTPLFRADTIRAEGRSPNVVYRYAHPLRADDMARVRDPQFIDFNSGLPDPQIANPLWGVLIIEQGAATANRQLIINRSYIILSGLLAGLLAVLVFYFITTRLILSPVRVLRETTERVSRGDLYVRSAIATGDEFEELSDTFNLMLTNLKSSQDQLRQVNRTLDLKLTELSQSNVMLAEANRLKSEFLANVSHELRTPLNSILGFAEVLQDAAPDEEAGEQASMTWTHEKLAKHLRYTNNILISGRALLELINDLLDLAKIEAGRMEINPESTSIKEVCEALVTLIKPQADKKSINMTVEISNAIPAVETDPVRFQQIIFNFLSNAVKFTPEQGAVRLVAERVREPGMVEPIRVSVSDTGPGIDREQQEFIFEKFRQADAGHTRRHSGTGLGLAICKELAGLLGGRIELHSEPGQGATFSVLLPRVMEQQKPQALLPGV
ncbi:MAG: HAMP domain-containing protein [Planctomycetes bacterium]|nr:HAMP domain-containing protein [Planctomycetota bacterium]NOG55922.1 HAMP domain-containing protein [Planctomycetota bacterium]